MANRVLVIGYGNPGRLDDGLGPALAETLQRLDLPGVTVDADYQLTAEDGLRKYKDIKPDVVIVDLMMEEVDAGITFVRDIKALVPTPPIYMLSSIGDNLNSNADYSQLGLNGVLQKPVNPKTLLKTLDTKLKA
jgi:DNA-binding response OmpR family regulator